MSIEYCHRCDVCGERAFVNWNVAERRPSDAPGWRRFTVIWGPDALDKIPSEYEICPDCANALREGRPAYKGIEDKLVRTVKTAPVMPMYSYGTVTAAALEGSQSCRCNDMEHNGKLEAEE